MTVNATAAKNLFDQLRALDRTRDGKHDIPVPLVTYLERRLLAALERDRTGTLALDGWPTSTTGNGSNGLPTSSVEAAVVARVDSPQPRDYHRALTRRAAGALEDAVVALNTLRSALASIDDLTKTTGPETKTCAHCTGKRGTGNDRGVYATGTVADRLDQPLALCSPCWHYTEQTATAGSQAGHLPSDEQIRDHETRGRWRIRVGTRNPT